MRAGGGSGGHEDVVTEVAGERRSRRGSDPDDADHKERVCLAEVLTCRAIGGLETEVKLVRMNGRSDEETYLASDCRRQMPCATLPQPSLREPWQGLVKKMVVTVCSEEAECLVLASLEE